MDCHVYADTTASCGDAATRRVERANRPHELELTLLTADGEHAVVAPGPFGDQPLVIEATFEVGRPAGIPEGSDIDHDFALNLSAGLPLEAGARYEWRLRIDDHHEESWTAPFQVRSGS